MKPELQLYELLSAYHKGDGQSAFLLACMAAVFSDYLDTVDAETFQKRFGTRGTEALSKFTL